MKMHAIPFFLALVLPAVVSSSALAAAPALGQAYVLSDRFCSDGMEALDSPIEDLLGSTLKFSETTILLSNPKYPGQDFSINYRLEGTMLISRNLVTGADIPSVLRVRDKTLTWVTNLPEDASLAKRICATASKLIMIFTLQ